MTAPAIAPRCAHAARPAAAVDAAAAVQVTRLDEFTRGVHVLRPLEGHRGVDVIVCGGLDPALAAEWARPLLYEAEHQVLCAELGLEPGAAGT